MKKIMVIQIKTVKCVSCGQLLTDDENIDAIEVYNNGPYCIDCYRSQFCVKCEKCERFFLINEATELPDNKEVYRCNDCLSPDYGYCERCGTLVNADEYGMINDDMICDACRDSNYFVCSFCDDWFKNCNAIIHDGESYCEQCFEDNFYSCTNCGETLSESEVCNYEGEVYCESCLSEDEDEDRTLHDYSYVPHYKFYGDSAEHLFFGIELEIENENQEDYFDDINNEDCQFYSKADSSLDKGLEIVSHPMTFEYFNENFKRWQSILNCRKRGYKSYDTSTCGIHIHISKKAFSTLQLYKFMKFFYINQKFIQIISQREADKLEEWADNSKTNINMAKKAKHKEGNEDRYSAINLQPNTTVEIRIFRGTLQENSFRKNMEFLHALYGFTKSHGLTEMTQSSFIEYAKKNAKQYKNLLVFINKRC